jgi:hypothetical protein
MFTFPPGVTSGLPVGWVVTVVATVVVIAMITEMR